MSDKGYIVYAHYIKGDELPFYIGEGRPKRINDRGNRNRYWSFKVKKHGGFESEILIDNIHEKHIAESMEAGLIQSLLDDGVELTNLSIGPAFGNHWSKLDSNYDKTKHPMYGKKFPDGSASKRMKRWNSERSGERSPVYGMKRPDLAERNKQPELHRKHTKEVLCVELDKKFKSLREAKDFIKRNKGFKNININRALDTGSVAGGYHWVRTGVILLEY